MSQSPTTKPTPSAQTVFEYDDLIRCGQGNLFTPNSPRLPAPPMLMIDRIKDVSREGGNYESGILRGELNIDPKQWFFDCHFIGDPVMPGCLGLDAMWQMLGFYLGWLGHEGKGRALGVQELRFTGQVLPTHKKATYHIHIKRIMAGSLVMGVADGELEVDGNIIYVAKGLKTGLFKEHQL